MIKVQQSELSKVLNQVSKASSSKPTIPILSNTHISVLGGKLVFFSTDIEIGIRSSLSASIEKEFEDITVNARQLSEYINSLTDTELKISRKDKTINIENEYSHAEFTTIPPGNEYPALPRLDGLTPILEISGTVLLDSIHKTVFAVSTDNIRPVLTGVLFEFSEGKLNIVGVDGYRLSRKSIKVDSKFNAKYIIPSRALKEVANIIDNTDEIIQIFAINKGEKVNQIAFKYRDVEIYSRLIDGEFPDYNAILPKSHTVEFKMDRHILAANLKTIDTFAKNIIGNKTSFKFDTSEKNLHLKVQDPERGIIETNLDIFEVEGNGFETGFNARYLSDMCSSISSNEILFRSAAAGMPAQFINPNDSTYLHIIMPMKVEN